MTTTSGGLPQVNRINQSLPTLLALCLLLAGTSNAQADSPPLDADVLHKIKQSTVLLKVSLANGRLRHGSGFFAFEPGLVLTNAHVLGMRDPAARPPRRIEVTLHSGETDSRTLRGQLLGIDRPSDLAVLRVEGKDLPPPLKLGPTTELRETQELYIFGFPFGEQLGKDITVSKTTITSLRKMGTFLHKIQVQGGMHPGNSGGPLTNRRGEVVGVAVAGIQKTPIHFAEPADHITAFLNGRGSGLGFGLPYRDGEQVKLPVHVEVLDPLGRLRKVAVECFTGLEGPARPASSKEPAARAGDADRQVVTLAYDKKTGIVRGEIVLPLLRDPKRVYWLRPVVTNGLGETRWFGVRGQRLAAPLDRQAIALRPRRPGGQYDVELQQQANFRVRDAVDEEFSLGLDLKMDLRERVGDRAEAATAVPVRLQGTSCRLSVLRDGRPLEGDEDLRRYVRDLSAWALEAKRDAEGSLVHGRADLSRVPRESRAALAEVSEQLLRSLELLSAPLPAGRVKPLQSWEARRAVIVGIPGASTTGRAELQYSYLGLQEWEGQKVALIELSGTMRGRQGEGLDANGKVTGVVRVAVETGVVVSSAATLQVDADLTFRGKPVQALGTLAMQLKRVSAAVEGK